MPPLAVTKRMGTNYTLPSSRNVFARRKDEAIYLGMQALI